MWFSIGVAHKLTRSKRSVQHLQQIPRSKHEEEICTTALRGCQVEKPILRHRDAEIPSKKKRSLSLLNCRVPDSWAFSIACEHPRGLREHPHLWGHLHTGLITFFSAWSGRNRERTERRTVNQIQQFLSLFSLSILWAKVLEETWILCPVEDWMTSQSVIFIVVPPYLFTTTDGCELFFKWGSRTAYPVASRTLNFWDIEAQEYFKHWC